MLNPFDVDARICTDADEWMFRRDVSETLFRDWSRNNAPPATWDEARILHPYCRDEWLRLNPEVITRLWNLDSNKDTDS